MKVMRLFILLTLMGPMAALASDACCAPEPGHEVATIDSCGPQTHIETQSHACDEDRCAECALCHLQSFSPNNRQSHSVLLSAPHQLTGHPHAFTEVVSAVLTPPPTR